MALESARPVRRVTFLLVALAAVAVEVAAADTRPVRQSVGLALVWVALGALGAALAPLPADPGRKPPFGVGVILLALGLAPLAIEPLRRDWTGEGYPLELRLVAGLRNVGLGLAACGGWVACVRLAGVVSLFLILFAAAMSNHPAVMVALGSYSAAGSIWLTLVYWTGLKGVLVAPDKAASVEIVREPVRFPWAGLTLLALAVGGGLALAAIGPRRGAYSLGELVPTSGGTGETDPFARYGVGDGPEEVAGENARAAGMVETDRMIEDNKNSLIDAVSDAYGPPHKPSDERERMVAAGLASVTQLHGDTPDNRRPSRDFDTSRQGPKGDKEPESRAARGLFEVEGRTPLHVRRVTYDRYDSGAHRWIESCSPAGKLVDAEGGDWMNLGQFRASAGWYADSERHKLKAADMGDNLVPTPTLLTRFRINKVDKPDYYGWDTDGVLILAGRVRTPPGVVVTTECRTVDAAKLPGAAFASSGLPASITELPAPLRAELRQLALRWAGDTPRGGAQIMAILTRLEADYALDAAIAAPDGHPAPVLWFLTESRRGPDYLFATAAALLLRSLDYPTRVCLGYYAAPAAYDPETGHTPVRKSDLHTWAEVRLADGHWLVAEATPGYAALGPKRPLTERVLEALAAAARWARRHALGLAIAWLAAAASWRNRRELADGLATMKLAAFPGRTWEQRVFRAVRVLERRGHWAKRGRARDQTANIWLASLRDADLDCLGGMAQWATYAEHLSPPWSDADVADACRRAVANWPLRRWRGVTNGNSTGART